MSSNGTLQTFHTRAKTEIAVETSGMVLIFLIGAISNPLTGIMVCKNRRLRNLHNALTINLIVADSIATFFCVPPVIFTLAFGKWIFGKVFCHFIGFLTFVVGISCLWTILWLSVMRLLMLTKPQVYALIVMPKYIICIIISTWSIALLSGVIVNVVGTFAFKPKFAVCFFVFDDIISLASVMTPLVLLPIFFLTVLTTVIVIRMKHRKENKLRFRYHGEEREIAKTYVILVLVYIICYFPVFLIEANFTSNKGQDIHVVPVLATYLGLLPFSLKTLINVMTKKAFRKELIALLHRRNRVNVTNTNLQTAWHTAMLHDRRENEAANHIVTAGI